MSYQNEEGLIATKGVGTENEENTINTGEAFSNSTEHVIDTKTSVVENDIIFDNEGHAISALDENVIIKQPTICENNKKTEDTDSVIGENKETQITTSKITSITELDNDLDPISHTDTSISSIKHQLREDTTHTFGSDSVERQIPETPITDFKGSLLPFCQPCHCDGINEEASGFCVVCAEYLCRGCLRDHKRNKVTRRHTILQDEKIPGDVTAFVVLRELMQCKVHPEQDVAYICSEHSQNICLLCLAQLHRKCEGITELGMNEEPSKINTMCEKQNDIGKRLTIFGQKQGTRIKHLKEEHDVVVNDCQNLANQWILHVEQLKQQLKLQASKLAAEECARMEQLITDSTVIEAELESMKQLAHAVRQYGSKQETCVVVSHFQNVQSTIMKKLSVFEMEMDKHIKLFKTVHVRTLEHLADVKIAVEANNDVHLTSEELRKGSSEDRMCHRETQVDMTMEAKVFNNRAYTERQTGSSICLYKIKSATDLYTCSISAIGSMPDGCIIFADASNKKLKVWGCDHDIVNELSLPGSPIDMCIYENDVYICYSDRKFVSTISFWSDQSISFDKEFPTSKWPVSVSPIDDRLLVLFLENCSDFESTFADIHVEIRRSSAIDARITNYSDDDEMKLTAKKVLVMSDNEVIFGGNDRITCYKIGETKTCLTKRNWFYKSYKTNVLKKASGMAIDEEGNVYVCGEESNNVHQVSCKNYRNNKVIINDIPKPISVCVDTTRSQLIIGCRSDDYVHVYYFV